jgi:type IV secretion system protein VirD4
MWIIQIIFMVCNLVFKGVILLLKLAEYLFRLGVLFHTVVTVTAFTLSIYFMAYFGEQERFILSTVSCLAMIGSLFIGTIWILRTMNKKRSATPASNKPEKANPTPKGVVFGKIGKNYITKPEDTDGHVLVIGGVGSGKSSCIAIPTLRVWNECVFAIDIKGELHEQSETNRPNVKVFNPLDGSSYGYDPFYCLRTSENPTQEARAIAQAIIPLPPDTKEPFWVESAQGILTGAILHYNGQGLSFLDTIRKIQSISAKSLIGELCQNPETVYFVNNFSDIDERTLSSVMAELSKNIVPFATDKNLISALSRENNITPEDLECGYDVYVQIPEHLLRQWKTLLTLIVNQFLTHFEKRHEKNAQPILFLLDEFPRLGKVNAMLDGLATLRSKKICICLIVQSLAQLDMIYGVHERKVICDTCSYKAVLGATDADTQEYFSRLVGTYDKSMTSYGTQTGAYSLVSSTSTSTHDVEKRIIKPEEFGQLEDIVLLTQNGMSRVEKTPYYLDKE